MSSKILLVNFAEKDLEKLKDIPLVFERGYLSDIKESTKQDVVATSLAKYDSDPEERKIDDLDFYFPHPIYEYKMVFVNLGNNENVKKEFRDKTKKMTEDDRKDFFKYWLLRDRPLAIFVGDYRYKDLFNVGVPNFNLKSVVNNDVAINVAGGTEAKEMAELFNELKPEVKMPTNYYIQVPDDHPFAGGKSCKLKNLLWNNNNADLALFLDYDINYSSKDRPRVIVMPQFKNNYVAVEKLLKLINELRLKYFPEWSNSDWTDSDKYYPEEVLEYEKKAEALLAKTKSVLTEWGKQKEAAKEKYKTLHGLLTQSGDDLKSSALDILKNVFKLQATDSDEEKDALPDEDLIISFEEELILAEVKGVNAENPSPIYISQVWKHLARNKDKKIKRGALILNHDLKTDPKDRNDAYKGAHEKELDDIIFIDTRVMFKLASAIIDFAMSPDEAAAILLQNGRVGFDLEKYVESKKQRIAP